MPQSIAQVLRTGAATLREVEEYYSLEDVSRMLEVESVKAENTHRVNQAQARKNASR